MHIWNKKQQKLQRIPMKVITVRDSKTNKKLTIKQELFVKELVKGKSQRKSYKKAYPHTIKWKPTSIDVSASRMFANPKVKLRYNQLMEIVRIETEKECIVESTEIIRELKKIGFSDITDFISFETRKTLSDNDGEAIAEYRNIIEMKPSSKVDGSIIQEVSLSDNGKLTFKLHSKLQALEKLGKALGMFADDVNMNITIPPVINIVPASTVKK